MATPAELTDQIISGIAGVVGSEGPESPTYQYDLWLAISGPIIAAVGGGAPQIFSQVLLQENCNAYDPITSMGWVADSANPSRDLGRVIGLAGANGSTGNVVQVITVGEIQNPAWTWTRGDYIFINGSSLIANTPAPSGFICMIGQAKDVETIIVFPTPQTQILL